MEGSEPVHSLQGSAACLELLSEDKTLTPVLEDKRQCEPGISLVAEDS